jgi:phosphoesterase RecJ-like protein
MTWLDVPESRVAALDGAIETLARAHDAVLTTHIHADGDGAGSEVALAVWLRDRGTRVHIVNPTPYPDQFRHLLPDDDLVVDLRDARIPAIYEACDTLVVVDTGEWGRIGKVGRALNDRTNVVMDHHLPGNDPITGTEVRDASACATGELIYDLFMRAGTYAWSQPILDGIYTAVLTDTGSFRFANSTPRAHAIAADLIARGVDPEDVYRRVYATVPLRRVALLRHALDRLEVDPELPLAWLSIERGAMEALGCTADDVDGIVEHARSIEGTEVAVLFRGTSDGGTKVSLRSSGDVDVNEIARRFAGGGHEKASGAVLPVPLEQGRATMLGAVRAALRAQGFPRPFTP